jgi:hypothetical protein
MRETGGKGRNCTLANMRLPVECPDAVVTHDIADMMRKAGSIRIVCGIFELSEGYWT